MAASIKANNKFGGENMKTNEEEIEWVRLFKREAETLLMFQVPIGRNYYPEVLGIKFQPKNLKYEGWIYDVSKKDTIYFEGKEVEWKDIDKLKEIYGNELSILDKMENKWIASDLYPEDFIKTEEYKKTLEEMRNMYAKYVPEMKNIPLEDIAYGLGERLTNRLGNSTDSAKKWYQIKLKRAKTNEEKKKLGEKYKILRQQNMIDAINASSKTAKDIFQIYLKSR